MLDGLEIRRQRHNCTHVQVAIRPAIKAAADAFEKGLEQGGKVLLAGNGGSAADAQHIAAEFVGRFVHDRAPLAAIALTTDTSALTAIGNDYGFEQVFARQVSALARPGDVLVGISTSGKSPNIVAALNAARKLGMVNIGMTRDGATPMHALCDVVIGVPATETALIVTAFAFKHTQYPNAAKAYLMHMFETEPYSAWQEACIGYWQPTLKAYDALPFWSSDPKLTPFRDIAKNMLYYGYSGSLGGASSSVLADYVVVQMFAAACSGQMTPKEAAADGARRAQRYYRA